MTGRIAGVILAGGRGQRMGGMDKGLVTLGGRVLVSHVIEALRPQVDEIVISANRNRARYAALGHRVVADTETGQPGPLAGMAAGLAAVDADWVQFVPCDAPHPPPDLVERLRAAAMAAGAPGAVPWDGARRQPVHALLERRLAESVAAAATSTERGVGRWLERMGAVTVDFSDCPAGFAGANTPAELRRLERRGVGTPTGQ